MNQSTNQTFSSQPQNNNNQSINQPIGSRSQNNNGQLQRPHNIGSSQNAGGLFQGAPNTGMQLLRPQNSTNLFANTFIDVQQYNDLIGGIDLFPGTQGVENPPPQDDQFSTLLISGHSFP
ncbi:19749_t:CDS:1 [Dentiscutata erythropus]|uniref:19749_t:CDS:1 n=1 Tax=Dentiscutata erythropus TaxID=1348616 RepID=A0A9N9ERV0_9GLOM|nr:19749_t:CDS:1 [Dentiscutata erythropus]